MNAMHAIVAMGVACAVFVIMSIIEDGAIGILHAYGSYDTFRDNAAMIIPIGAGLMAAIVTALVMEKRK